MRRLISTFGTTLLCVVLLWFAAMFNMNAPSSELADLTISAQGVLAVPRLRNKARWRVLVFANQRISSLKRLCRSLQAAHINEMVPLNFVLEASQPRELYDYVSSFEWPHGPVQITARHSRGGLINAIMEGWFPRNDGEWAFFLEDDIEVSPHFMTWASAARRWCELDRKCIGVSLYSPMLNELVYPKEKVTEFLRANGAAPAYMAQIPCSWGAAYAPGPWQQFRLWAMHYPQKGNYVGDMNLGRASGWSASWKRYLLEMMLPLDWTLIYPFIDGKHAGYATNHLEKGEHIKMNNDTAHRREDYELLLLKQAPPPLLSAPRLRVDNLYRRISHNLDKSIQIERIEPRSPKVLACTAYSLQGHDILLQPGLGVTVVITFFYSEKRFEVFLENVKKYCSYSTVKRILVVWHNHNYRLPKTTVCNEDTGTTAHFLEPPGPDTLSNRFIPTYRILTRAVLTVDDDILVSETDVLRMSTVLLDTGYTRVVGPFPRWYVTARKDDSTSYEYKYAPGKSSSEHPEGYPIILTKAHISHYSLYYHYFCDKQYESVRKSVQELRNGEDLLYMKVAGDIHTPPGLFMQTQDAITDAGKVGLSSRHDHYVARSAMVKQCGLNSSFWSYDVVLSPGTKLSQYNHKHFFEQKKLVDWF